VSQIMLDLKGASVWLGAVDSDELVLWKSSKEDGVLSILSFLLYTKLKKCSDEGDVIDYQITCTLPISN